MTRPPPIYSPRPLDFFDLLEAILTYGREEILIPGGLTGGRRIHPKFVGILQSYNNYNAWITLEGPKLDEDGQKYYYLWYKHEYDGREENRKRQQANEHAHTLEYINRNERFNKALERMIRANGFLKKDRETAIKVLTLTIDGAEGGDENARNLLTLYGYYEKPSSTIESSTSTTT